MHKTWVVICDCNNKIFIDFFVVFISGGETVHDI
jgi:hypothetical protein